MKSNNKGSAFPPQQPGSLQVSQKIRYIANSNFSTGVNLNVNDIMDTITVATAAAVGYRVCDAVRIRKVEMWAQPVPTATTPTLISLEELGSTNVGGRSRTIECMGMGQNRPAHIVWKPTRGTFQDTWFTNITTNTPVLLLKCIAGTVVDVSYDLVLIDGSSAPAAVANSISGATVGQIYVRSFCTAGASTNNFPPVGVLSI